MELKSLFTSKETISAFKSKLCVKNIWALLGGILVIGGTTLARVHSQNYFQQQLKRAYATASRQSIQYDSSLPEKKIVILIPSYNNSRWYKENLDSIINQNYSNYRIVYVDDCSPDNTGQLVETYIKECGK